MIAGLALTVSAEYYEEGQYIQHFSPDKYGLYSSKYLPYDQDWSDGEFSWDADTATLTLNNFNDYESGYDSRIYFWNAPIAVTVNLVGENKIDLIGTAHQETWEGELPDQITYTGTGTLKARGVLNNDALVTVDDVEITCQEWSDRGLILKSGSISATYYKYKLYADQEFTIEKGSFSVDVRNNKYSTYAIESKMANVGDYGYKMADENGEPVTIAQNTKISGEVYCPYKSDGSLAEYVKITNPYALPFEDVTSNDYFYAPVKWAVANNVTTGLSDTEFGPDQDCTRGQVVTFLWRAAGQPEPASTENPFTDVSESDYFYKAVLWAVEKGITNGYGAADTFCPEVACTRGQVATFLWRAEG